MLHNPKFTRAYIRIVVMACILLLLLLAGFQWIWVGAGSASSIMIQVGLQRTRVQAITKNVLILAYRPAIEHPQAISELQNTLPRFEQTQRGLLSGDVSLQLPTRVPEDITQLVLTTQSDFISIDTATKVILSNPHNADLIQVAIVVEHEHNYALTMNTVNTAWQLRIDSAFLHLYWIESGLVGMLILVIGGNYLFIARRIITS